MKKVFGFGSLLSLESLKSHAPLVEELTPVKIKGYRRTFSVWDPLGFTRTFLEISGIGFCALDVQTSDNYNDEVNGVVFTVSNDEFEELKIREQDYEVLITECFDFFTNAPLGECYFFSANKNNGIYNHGCKAQEKYLEVCIDGAKSHGEKFYKTFLETTFIGDKNFKNFKS